jgi:predicted SnoaL-like aldol condensation-catalyzing enzyme
MSPEEKKTFVRKWIEKVWDAGDFSAFEKFAVPEYTFAAPGIGPLGREALEAFVTDFRRGLPDLHNTIEDQVAEGGKVVTRGTHTGAWSGIPASRARVECSWFLFTRFDGDKIAEDWEVYDSLTLMQQIGTVRMTGSAGAQLLS